MPFYVSFYADGSSFVGHNLFEANDDVQAKSEFDLHSFGVASDQKHLLRFRRCELDAFEYYPRMARPQLGLSSYIGVPGNGPLFLMEENMQSPLPHNSNSLSSSVNQLSLLVGSLREIFRSVEPVDKNMKVHGHTIRNTLLLAAMEFENECKGLLTEHSYVPTGGSSRWNTTDFVKVSRPLRLAEYNITLSHYPSLKARNPFKEWDRQSPTKSLAWYDAYNSAKHDREKNFERATLEHAIDAVLACAIMLTAQYRIIKNWRDQLGDFFRFVSFPEWDVETQYVNHTRGKHPNEWKPVKFPFS